MVDLKAFLDDAVDRYNIPDFIENDPISIPHQYTVLQDIEITAFWTSMLSWGNRKAIISSCTKLFALMDNSPYQFIKNHNEIERKVFEKFVHRTFNYTDTLYFIEFFQHYYKANDSLQNLFCDAMDAETKHVEPGIIAFHNGFFDHPFAPQRTKKHVSSPLRNSTCKRLNMFLRWMVRNDKKGVDFGLWKNIKPSQLLMPLDVHVDRVARKYNLLTRKQTDWQAVLELTDNVRKLDQTDPVKYDFALFGLGVMDKIK